VYDNFVKFLETYIRELGQVELDKIKSISYGTGDLSDFDIFSLRHALKSDVDFDTYIDTYRKVLQNPTFRTALSFYTYKGDLLINTYLHGFLYGRALTILSDKYMTDRKTLVAETKKLVITLNECIESLPPLKIAHLYRGVKLDGKPHKVGDIIDTFYDTYTSTSINRHSALNFVGHKKCCFYKINVPPEGIRGVYVAPVSGFKGEFEFLLPPGYRFKVTDTKKVDGVTNYTLVPV
jgi:hypothetical protein